MLARRSHLLLTSLALALAGASCSSSADSAADTTAVQSSVPFDEQPTALDELVGSFLGDHDGGIDVLRITEGIVERSAAGDGSAAGEALEPGRAFRVGSISKSFVAVMVLQLVDEGLIDLDQPLGTYLTETPAGADITIRQLLSHRSGLANYTDQRQFFLDAFADLAAVIAPETIIAYVINEPSGTVGEFSYSNTNYILLGQLIESVDGRSLNESLSARVTGPTGLADTYFEAADHDDAVDLVGGYSAGVIAGDVAADYRAISSGAWAAGALVSTTDDLAAFLAALLNAELTSAESLEQMMSVGDSGSGIDYGFGLHRLSLGVGHGGAIPGYMSAMAIDPENGDTIVVLVSNDELQADTLAKQVDELDEAN